MSIFHSDDVKMFNDILTGYRELKKEIQHVATLLEQLTAGVADENTAIGSLIQLFDNFVATANQNINDPVAMQALINTVANEKAAIIADIVKNTPQTPTITSLLPTSGPVGSTVVINGSGFGLTQSASKVTFNGVDAGLATNWTDTQITVTVPPGATTGDILVVTTVGGSSARGSSFSVDGSTPAVQAQDKKLPLDGVNAPGSGVASPAVGTQVPNPNNPASTAIQPDPNPNTPKS
jgi:hypothetical protein